MHDRCVSAHEVADPKGRAVVIVTDEQWGYLPLCAIHSIAVDPKAVVLRRDA
jgi:predicted transcriptional regulator